MKRIVTFVSFAAVFFSCKKEVEKAEEIPQTPHITFISSLPVQSITPPKDSVKVFQYIVDVYDRPGFRIAYGDVGMSAKNGLNISDITNVRVVYKSKQKVEWSKLIATTATSSYYVDFYPPAMDRPDRMIDTIQVFANVSQNAMGKLETDMYISYRWGNAPAKDETLDPQTVNFVATSLGVAISSTTPPSGLTLSGAEPNVLVLDLTATGQPLKLNTMNIISDVTYIDQTRIYVDSTVLIGSTTHSGSGVVTKAIPISMPEIPAGTTKRIWIRQRTKTVSNGPSSSPTIKTGVASIVYTGSDNIVRTYSTQQTGNDLYLYNALPIFTEEVLSGSITNDVPKILKRFRAKTIGGSGALKQFTYAITQIASGGNQNRIVAPKIKINGVTATNVIFVNQAGQKIDSILPSDSRVTAVFVSGPGQSLDISNTEKVIELEGTVKGYTNGTDYIRIDLAIDNTPIPGNYRYINPLGASVTNQTYYGLYNSPTSSVNAIFGNVIWSEKSDGPANSGAPYSGSNAWYNGYYIVNNPFAPFVATPQYWYQ